MKIEYRLLSEPTQAELNRAAILYTQGGWIDTPEAGAFLDRALRGSTVVAGAFDDGILIGLGRALSDGFSDAYIQDVIVDQAFRRRGIGGALLHLLYAELRKRGVDWIALVGEPGTEGFYSGLGLRERKNHSLWQFPENWK